MRLGLLSDPHSNCVGLEAVIRHLQSLGVDKIFCCGDLVGYSVQANEVIETMQDYSIECIIGNHDAMFLADSWHDAGEIVRKGLEVTQDSLSVYHLEYLRLLPTQRYRSFEENGYTLLFLHGTPDNPVNGYLYPQSVDKLLLPEDVDILLVGHTHISFVAPAVNGLVINPGSCGLPRDGDPRVGCAVLDTLSGESQHYRLLYDCSDVVSRNLQAGIDPSVNDYLLIGCACDPHLATGYGDHPVLYDVVQRLMAEGAQVVRNTAGVIAEFPLTTQGSFVVMLVVLSDAMGTVLLRTSPTCYRWWDFPVEKLSEPRLRSNLVQCGLEENSVGYFLQSHLCKSIHDTSTEVLIQACIDLRDSYLSVWKELQEWMIKESPFW